MRDENRRLVPVEPAASAVAEVFRRRALGASWAELAALPRRAGRRDAATGNAHWSKTGVAGLIKNPVYLGQARSGSIVKEDAHEALVTRAEFDAAQSVTKSLLTPRDGSLAAQAMLGGLARCAGCGHTLKITGNTDRQDAASATRSTTARAATRRAPAPPALRHARRSSMPTSKSRCSRRSAPRTVCSRRRSMPQRRSRKPRARSPRPSTSSTSSSPTRSCSHCIGEEKFLEGVEARQRALDEARETLAELRTQSTLADELADGDLLQAWPTLTVQEKRRLLHGLLDRVVVVARTRARQEREPGERAHADRASRKRPPG